ncbi:hypothetical protein [Baekduia soli]|uniref:hypothetical protein n=1 Tax=Baekduia soli TaxID=496014 RepID=UPI00165298FB|nr:hypothetical protein [Baekduia soli]
MRWGVAAIVVALALALGGSDGGRGSGGPPASGAAALVPADVLVYVHLSTDPGRPATRRAAAMAARFPSWPRLRDSVVRQLAAPDCRTAADALKGANEAALALFYIGKGTTANSLVLVDAGGEHADGSQRGCGALSVAYVGHFLAIGQPESLSVAQDLQRGRGTSLAAAAGPRRVFARLPADRAADGWVSADGVRRLLAPQGGLLGVAGVLLNQPGLTGAGFALSATRDGARIVVRSLRDPAQARKAGAGFRPFSPTLQDAAPAGAMSYLGVSNLAPALRRLLAAAGSGSKQLAPLVQGIDTDLLRLFAGEAAIILTPATPAPVLTLLARTQDEAATRRALARLPVALRRAFRTAVFDGKVAVSTSAAGIRAVQAGGPHLSGTDQWSKSVGNHPQSVSSLLFLDFSRLLQLGEQTGLGDSSAYQAAKSDLEKVRSIGADTSGNDSESTAEISLLITP